MRMRKWYLFVFVFVILFSLTGCSSDNKKWVKLGDMNITHASYYEGFLNESFGITVGYSGEIHYTLDGGKTWPKAVNQSYCRYGLSIVDSNVAWASGNGNQIRVTNDGGKTWTAVTDFKSLKPHCYTSFIDNKTGWVGAADKFGATKDGGKTWSELKLPNEDKLISSLFLRTEKDGYALTTDGTLYTTTDFGQTWASHDLGFGKLGFENYDGEKGKINSYKYPTASMSFTDDKKGMVVLTLDNKAGKKAFMLRTDDGGATWSREEVKAAEDFKPDNVYLSRDGQYLTLSANNSNDKRIILMKYQ